MSEATTVFWKWEDEEDEEDEEDDGEGVGPVWIRHAEGSTADWEQWVRRSVAESYAIEHGFEFHGLAQRGQRRLVLAVPVKCQT